MKRTGESGLCERRLTEPWGNPGSRSAWVLRIGCCDVPGRTAMKRSKGDVVTSASIRRRLHKLEGAFGLALMPEYPPFTRSELTGIEQRLCAGDTLTRVELHRIEKQTPIIDGEFLICCHHGQVYGKRYIGIDLADV